MQGNYMRSITASSEPRTFATVKQLGVLSGGEDEARLQSSAAFSSEAVVNF